MSGQLAGLLGADADGTQSAVGAAIPAMLASLANNSSRPDGAEALASALDRHDGSVLDQLGGGFGHVDTGDGEKIVNHMFGTRKGTVENELASRTGLPLDAIAKLLPMLAPIVLGMLGRQKRSSGLGAGDLASMLNGEKSQAAGMPGLGGLLSKLDLDGDGNPMNDLAGMLGGAGAGAGAAGGGAAASRSGGGGLLGKVLGGLFKRR